MMSQLEVHVACIKREQTEAYPFPENRLHVLGQSFTKGSGGRDAARSLWKKIKKHVWHKGRGIRNRLFRSRLKTVLNQVKPDGVLFHYGTAATRFHHDVRSRSIPYAIHFNGFDLSEMLRDAQYRNDLATLLPDTKKLIVVADYMKDALCALNASSKKVFKIPYGVPLSEFKPSHRVGNTFCKFLSVGRLTPKKQPLLTIQAFKNCFDSCPNCSLTMIGDGPLEASAISLINQLGLNEYVHLAGAQTSDEVRKAMQEHSVFVQHSVTSQRGDREGWPVAIAEAAASGMPVIATRHASIPEQVIDGVSGILVDEFDLDSMSKAMIRLARTPDIRESMGQVARKHISQWDVESQVDQLEQVLNSMLGYKKA